MAYCCFPPEGNVNWESLRVLKVEVGRIDGKIEDVLSGCPSLESLSLCRVHLFGEMHIVHKKLKRLLLDDIDIDFEDVLSGCPSLESLSLCRVHLFSEMHIVHEKLKRLLLDDIDIDFEDHEELKLHVKAPQLEELEILGNWFLTSFKLIDIISLVRVRVDIFFGIFHDDDNWKCLNAVKEFFEGVRHSQELHIVVHYGGDLGKMVMESLCATLSHRVRKCLVKKESTDESSDDESSYEVRFDEE